MGSATDPICGPPDVGSTVIKIKWFLVFNPQQYHDNETKLENLQKFDQLDLFLIQMKIYVIDSDKDQMDPEKDQMDQDKDGTDLDKGRMDPDKKGSKRRLNGSGGF